MARVPDADRATDDVADGVIAAGLRLGGKPGKALDEAYENLRIAVDEAYPRTVDARPHACSTPSSKRGLTPTVPTDYERWQPLHWILAVPDVMDDGGFDAVIGNPPFLGGQKLTGALGHQYPRLVRSMSSQTERRAAPTWSPTSSCAHPAATTAGRSV